MTSHVEAQITARIQAARRRTEDMRRQRAELAEARRAGLAHRHARKLRNLAEAEQRSRDEPGLDEVDDQATVGNPTDGQDDGEQQLLGDQARQ